jgi:integrase
MRSRGTIHLRKDWKRRGSEKRFVVIIEGPRDGTGKRKQYWTTVWGTRLDAERKRTELLAQHDRGIWIPPSKLTVERYLEEWLAAIRHQVSARTLQGYDDIVRKRLIPNLGHHSLAKLRPGHIIDYYRRMLTEGRARGKATAGLSARTVLSHHRVLSAALKRAYQLDLIAANPCGKLPRSDTPKPLAKDAGALDEAGMAALLRASEGGPLHAPILVALMTGVRRGELLALRWQDIDLAPDASPPKGELRVTRSLQQLRGQEPSFTTPKTRRSRRALAIEGRIVTALRDHRTAQNVERVRLGFAWHDNDLVFPGPDGRPWPPEMFTRAFVALARRPGVPRVRFHDLRHTHLTNLLVAGVPLRTVADRAGHSTPQTTLGVYAHTFKTLDQGAAEKAAAQLDDALAKATKAG